MAFPDPSDTEAIRQCREQRRDIYSASQVRNPALFVPMDSPLQCLAPVQQRRAEDRIRKFVGENIEGAGFAGLQGEVDVPAEVDKSISMDENIANLAEQIGVNVGPGMAEIEEDEVDRLQRDRATEEVVTICEALDDAGLDGARALERLFEGEDEQVRQLLEGTDIAGGLDEIEATLASLEEEMGGTFVAGAIAECRDLLGGPADGDVAPTQEILEDLRQRFGVTAVSPDQALAELEERISSAERTGQEAALNRLERGFGQRFGSVDDAVDRLRERIATARGERLRIADLQVRRVGGEVRIRVDASDLTEADERLFRQWQDNAERRIRRELDLNQLPAPSPWVTVGEIAVRGEDLDMIDLQEGRERLGEVAAPEPLEEEQPPAEQAELPAAETDAEQLADRAIDLLEG